jgi:hypothetical protein
MGARHLIYGWSYCESTKSPSEVTPTRDDSALENEHRADLDTGV